MYVDGTVRHYCDSASAGTPTPGGGSVAALAGALGMTMSCMAANFTVGKEKFKLVEAEVKTHLDSCLRARDQLLHLVDEDARAYAVLSAAYAMPRGTPEQRNDRAAAIQRGLLTAMDVPLQTLRVCRDVMPAIERLAVIANPNLISDVGVSAILAEAALRAARLNVEINLKEIKDAGLVASTRQELEEAARSVGERARGILSRVTTAIGGAP